jgi:ADP-dependent NAD(P)H-hydrate dehydratase / NAD(P)H-hydrate epimerase
MGRAMIPTLWTLIKQIYDCCHGGDSPDPGRVLLMQAVLTAEEYRRVDRAYRGDLSRAMEMAGYAVALAAARAGATYGSRVVVLAGPGNNGGDGYVAARHLKHRGAFVTVHALAEPTTSAAKDAAQKASAAGVPIADLGDVVEADLVVDAVFGGGSRRGLPESVLQWMTTTAPVVAIDYPTGLDPDAGTIEAEAFRAVETVTFSTLKTGHVLGVGPEQCGRVTVVDIGIHGGEPSMYIAEEADALRPLRSRKAHKWSAGAVLIVGGSAGLMGASVLAGRSALNFGAGTVYVATPRVDLVQQVAPEMPAFPIEAVLDQLRRFDVVVAGPGLVEDDLPSVRPILEGAQRVVLDAGGLTPSTLRATRAGGAEVVVTPHDAEFVRIAGVEAGTFAVRAFAEREGITVLRKGNPTMISDGGLPILVTSGGPELASIGTGDVLAGMIAALWARGLGPREAAVSAAYWHGRAGAELAVHETVSAKLLVDHISTHAW